MIVVRADAAEKLLKLIAKENEGKTIPETFGLRLFVGVDDCSEFQYCLKIEPAPKTDDQVFESNGVRIFVDFKSIEYLDGAEIRLGQ